MIPHITFHACREYQQYIGDEEDEYPAIWSEWMDPESMRFIAGWYRDPPDDETEAMGQGERVELVLPLYQAAEFVLGWHGSVWDFNIEGFYSTDDYRTGRESMDTLFVQDGPGVDSLHVLVELLGAS